MIKSLIVFLGGLLFAPAAWAHVNLTSPAEGASIDAGAAVEITWSIAVNHGPPDTYDLMFSADGGGRYQMVAEGLRGAPASYDWTAPATGVPNAVLSIVQHGSNGYTYMHSVSFTVVGDAGGDVGVPDGGFFEPPPAEMAITDDGGVPTTGEEVGALLDLRCAMSGCHAAEGPQAGLALTSNTFANSLTAASLVDACDPQSSTMLGRLRGESGLRMPPTPEVPLSAAQLDALGRWIGGGALATGPFGEADCGDAESEGGGCTTSGQPDAAGWLILLVLGIVGRRRVQAS